MTKIDKKGNIFIVWIMLFIIDNNIIIYYDFNFDQKYINNIQHSML